MSNMQNIIQKAFADGLQLRQRCATELAAPIIQTAECMIKCLRSGGKILTCGNGGSSSDAQHFAGELVNRFEIDRPALASIALTSDASVITSIANDSAYEEVFARQVEALGTRGDVLLALSTSGNSANVLRAVQVAVNKGMRVIALTGKDGGKIGAFPGIDTLLNIPHTATPRIQEMHITCLHILCALVDESMFGDNNDH
ncbi:MAG: D-sedoheptulose 7-phosphate isomerase [Mariprofundaceae bacterium]|nr:D-sedoheptulose 7-phosphate isomerase [Mariprofundaceae bacterium]